MAEEVVELCIKNPGKHGDFRMNAQAGTTLAEVQQLIQRDYDGNPEPKTQTVCSYTFYEVQGVRRAPGRW
jgi:hypothetical protein